MAFMDFRTHLRGRLAGGRAAVDEKRAPRSQGFSERFADFKKTLKYMWTPVMLTLPIIYSVAIAFLILDFFVTAYMWICFPLYKVPLVRRRDYIQIDRERMPYLRPYQKLNCLYCSYGNGVLAYASEIAARTEAYWCPIKHEKDPVAKHKYYDDFLEYGDDCDFSKKWSQNRYKLTEGKVKTKPRINNKGVKRQK